MAGPFDVLVPAVDQVGDASLCKAFAQTGTVTIAQSVVEDSPGKVIILHKQ
jgi:hypothetical protein